MISKDLVVMADFDEAKTLDEMEFNLIPIWVRVVNLPLGMMDEEMGRIIGDKIGTFKEADVGEDGKAMGNLLRIKVIIDIHLYMRLIRECAASSDASYHPLQFPN